MILKIKNKDYTIEYYDTKYKFLETFNRKTGYYTRTGILDVNGKDTEIDPMKRSFPGLLDIGIMGGCKCSKQCNVDCYQGAREHNPDKDMSLELYKKIIDEGNIKGLQQVALGGAGNPNDHKDFIKILEYTQSKGIVPNYTTSGIGLTDEMVKATKKYCGAVAVSYHNGSSYTLSALRKFISAKCKTSIHFVLSNKSIDLAIRILKDHKLNISNEEIDLNTLGINAIIFLLYKPVGLGKKENVLSIENDKEKLKEFFSLLSGSHPFKIGFDSCSIPGILNFPNKINPDSIDTCEAGRFSAYINSNGIMTTCSFDQELKYGKPINEINNVETIWNDFNLNLENNCPECKNNKLCLGGCPLDKSILLCDRKEKSNWR